MEIVVCRQHCSMNNPLILFLQGRVLYDLIVYNKGKGANTPSYLLECDSEVTSELLALMKKYKIRKKVSYTFQDRITLQLTVC